METASGRQRIFNTLGIPLPSEAPIITDNGFTYTYGTEPKTVIGSETLKDQKINTRKGIDMYSGKNSSSRYDNTLNKMGNTWFLHPQDYIKKNYWDSKTHKAVKEGGDIAAFIASTPFLAYTGVEAAPYLFKGLKVVGQALTPSTWINGAGQALGYNLDKAGTAADLLLSSYFANEAGKEIDKNGLNWKSGFNALLSLAPMTKDTEAIEGVANAVKNTLSTTKSLVNDFKQARKAAAISRAVNGGINRANFNNVSVEHVSPYGMTKGSALDVGNEGIHMTKPGDITTYNIQKSMGYPYVRQGTWTFTNNTKPVEVTDVGYFGKGFNPEFDNKVAQGFTNFTYANRFEAPGVYSYMTMEPSFGLQLSKNVENTATNWHTPGIVTPEGYKLADGTLTREYSSDILEQFLGTPVLIKSETHVLAHPEWGKFNVTFYNQNGRRYGIGQSLDGNKLIYSTPEEGIKQVELQSPDDKYLELLKIKNKILNSRDTFIKSLPDEVQKMVRRQNIAKFMDTQKPFGDEFNIDGTELGNLFKSKIKQDIQDVYLSDPYVTRFSKIVSRYFNNPIIKNLIRNNIEKGVTSTYNKAVPIFYRASPNNGGVSNGAGSSDKITKLRFGLNGNAMARYLDDNWTSSLFHEFGHNLYLDDSSFSKYLKNYIQDLMQKNPPEYLPYDNKHQKYVDYLSNPNEFRQRIMEGFRYGIKEGNLSPEEIYNECNVPGFIDLKSFFKKDYLIKMLGLMLGTAPIIANTNDKSS